MKELDDVPDDAVAWTRRLHAVVDELAAPIARMHGARLKCRSGCAGCCADELTVFPLEAAVIARAHPELLSEGEPAPEGACAFLDGEGACRVYAERPYVCRTQGLPLRWLDHDEDDAPYEARDVCPLNADGAPLEELPESAFWTLGPFEARLAEKQASLGGASPPPRIPLRALFARTHDAVTPKRRLPTTR